MARLSVDDKDILIVSSDSGIMYTDWVVFDRVDENGVPQNLLFKSVKDRKNLFSIVATLRYPNGVLYPPEKPSVAVVRMHTRTQVIPYVFKCCGDRPTRLPEQIPYRLLTSDEKYKCYTPDVDEYINNLS